MADAVTVRTRNLIKNPLLKRRQFVRPRSGRGRAAGPGSLCTALDAASLPQARHVPRPAAPFAHGIQFPRRSWM